MDDILNDLNAASFTNLQIVFYRLQAILAIDYGQG